MKTSLLYGAALAMLGLAAAPLIAQTQTTTSSTSSGYVQTSKIIGTKVKTAQGEEVGVVKDVVLDRSNRCNNPNSSRRHDPNSDRCCGVIQCFAWRKHDAGRIWFCNRGTDCKCVGDGFGSGRRECKPEQGNARESGHNSWRYFHAS